MLLQVLLALLALLAGVNHATNASSVAHLQQQFQVQGLGRLQRLLWHACLSLVLLVALKLYDQGVTGKQDIDVLAHSAA